MELNKGNRGKTKYAPYDLVLLQLEAIDYITDNMDPLHGVLEEEVLRHLARLAAEMASKRSRAEHREIAGVVLSGLENQGEGRFLIGYSDPTNPATRVRADVELVRPVQGDDGSIELRVTPQAINLLLDALDTDIESAETWGGSRRPRSSQQAWSPGLGFRLSKSGSSARAAKRSGRYGWAGSWRTGSSVRRSRPTAASPS
ncbi:MAG: hypothetical protein ACR2MY_01520 [Candidatus Dormibacteria bacterium]